MLPPAVGSSPTSMNKNTGEILRERPTNPLAWITAIVFATLSVVVIITGVVVLSVYLAYRPKIPFIRVRDTHLNSLIIDSSAQLSVAIIIDMEADNDNTKSDAGFSDIAFELRFTQVLLASLRAAPFDVVKNSTLPLHYDVSVSVVQLESWQADKMQQGLKQGKVEFKLRGQARARWKVGLFVSVRFWTHLDCDLRYFYLNGSSIDLDCTSKSH